MGQALTELILDKIPNAYIVGISRDEQKQRLLPQHERLELRLADIRVRESLSRALPHPKFDCVFHLAALKCVDTLEHNVSEAIETNVIGTRNVVDFCNEVHSGLVMASTDKACYPVNAYGATKALAEKLVTSSGYKVCRYGNVLGSRGSFVPHIVKCLKEGTSIPITDPEMTRFWIKTSLVAEFLLDAASSEARGNILFPTEMFSAKVTSLVEVIANILGVDNYALKHVGLRPGEKIHETLQTTEEGRLISSKTSLGSYTMLLNYLKDVIA
jgi:UDP-N-acetylglucosamine 4,6-dehydratase